MGKLNVELNDLNMAAMANDMTLRLYEISRINEQKLFKHMSVIDYIAIWGLSSHMESTQQKQKIYLQSMAEHLQLPMAKVSKIVKELQDRGLVEWKHDGRGEEGTYIQVTETGVHLAEEQQNILKEHYRNVISKFGENRLIDLMNEIKELYKITSQEVERLEVNE